MKLGSELKKIKCPCCNSTRLNVSISDSPLVPKDTAFCICKKCGEYWHEDSRKKHYPKTGKNKSVIASGKREEHGSFSTEFMRKTILGIW